mgnify:CR=1 FL=1
MIGVVLDTEAKPLTNLMAESGLLAIPTSEKVVRLLPPLTTKDEEFEEALEIIEMCLAEMHDMPAPSDE